MHGCESSWSLNLIVHYVFPIFVDIPVIFHPLKAMYRCIFWWRLVWILKLFFFPSTFSSSATSAAIAHFFWLSPCYGKLYPHILLALEKKLSWINVTTWASTQDFVFHPQLTKMIPDINFFWFQFYIITSNDHFCHLLSFLSTAISWITNFYHVGVCPWQATGSKEAAIFAGKEVS